MSKRNNRALILGIIFIAAGILIISDRFFDFYLHYYLGWDVVLPAVGALLGLFLFVKGIGSSDKGGVFPGTVLLVLGVFYFLKNSYILPGLDWYESWPVFLIAFGLGFLMMFIFKPKDWGPLIPALILLVLGFGFLAEEWGFCYFDFWKIVTDYWPVILILFGIKFIFSSFRKKKPENPDQQNNITSQ